MHFDVASFPIMICMHNAGESGRGSSKLTFRSLVKTFFAAWLAWLDEVGSLEVPAVGKPAVKKAVKHYTY